MVAMLAPVGTVVVMTPESDTYTLYRGTDEPADCNHSGAVLLLPPADSHECRLPGFQPDKDSDKLRLQKSGASQPAILGSSRLASKIGRCELAA